MSDLIRRQDAIDTLEERLQANGYSNVALASELNRSIGYLMRMPSAQPEPQWIPCSERLPSKKEIVLITNSKGNVRCGQFRGTYEKYWTWKGNTLETVVAWMPLPEPWKGEQE